MPVLRPARREEVPALNALIAASAHALSPGFYTPAQTDALVRYVFGVDQQLIADGTYFVVEDGDQLAACGGWSRRQTLFGGDQAKTGPDPLLVPPRDAARIRAFFVAPAWARQGLARQLLDHSALAAAAHGFTRLELAATLPGEPFYRACGFAEAERFTLPLPGALAVPLVRMTRSVPG